MKLFDKLKEYDIVLASQSPRRQYLLKETHIPFRVVSKNVPEDFNEKSPPEDIVLSLCRAKANACKNELVNSKTLLITADTIVFFKGQVLNKPGDKHETANMLELLSDSVHDVYTGVCIKSLEKETAFFEKTSVTFEKLTPEEIWFYLENYKPFDKAGGYGIQEWIGLVAIKRIDGSYHNVVGLPVSRFFKELKNFIC